MAGVLALSSVACGAAQSGGSTGMTGAKVEAALNGSTMNNGHFTANGYSVSGPNRYAVAGEGDLQRTPVEALQMAVSIQTYTGLGAVGVKVIEIGGRTYTSFAGAAWTSTQSTSTFPSNVPTDYIGEETRAGVKVWHVEEVNNGDIGDEWVRESDGYLVYQTFTGADGATQDLLFTTYNQSPAIKAP